MITALLALLVLFMAVPALLGTVVLFYVFVLPMRPPADTSNRIAHLRLVWWALRQPEKFVDKFHWVTMDGGTPEK